MINPPVALPPGSLGWPVIGESIQYSRAFTHGAPERFMMERKDKYNNSDQQEVFKTSILGEKVAVVWGPAWNKYLFTNENKKPQVVRTWWPPSVHKLLGKCLATTSGEEGMAMKNIMAGCLNPRALSSLYIPTMNSMTRQHIHTHWQGKKVVQVFPTLKLHWLELICRLLMSVKDTDQIADHVNLFRVLLKGLVSIPINFPGTKFYKSKKAACAIKSWLLGIVQKRRDALERQSSATPTQDFLSHLLTSTYENVTSMPESEIVDNLLMLIMAGHDVSVVVMTTLIQKLAQHPKVYEKVLREQKEIASSKANGELLQWEDIQKMPYSWSVVCEVMRLCPPIQGAFREAMVDINYRGYHIPKGWKIYWSANLTHNDHKAYRDYENFDPSRFEETCQPPPYSFAAFGGGPRMCIGKEFARVQILIFLHNVVTRFQWELVDPDEKIEYDPVRMPVKGLPIRLHNHAS